MKLGPPDTPGWTVVGGRSFGDEVPGLPEGIWEDPWRSTGQTIRVTDPLYGNARTLDVMETALMDERVVFAVAEVSNGVFLFAAPLYGASGG
jgi:hypothetical protein